MSGREVSFTSWLAERPRGKLCAALGALLLASILAAFGAPGHLSPGYMALPVALSVAAVLAHCAYRYHATPRPVNWLTVDTVFVAGYWLVHLFVPTLYVTGLWNDPGDKLWWSRDIVCSATAMSVSGLIAFLLGFHALPQERHAPLRPVRRRGAYRWWVPLAKGMLLAGAALIVLEYGVLHAPAARYLGVQDWPMRDRRLLLLGRFLLSVGLVVTVVTSAQLARRRAIAWVCGLALTAALLAAGRFGDRSLIVQVGVTGVAAYSEYVRRIRLRALVGALLAGVLLMSAIQIARSQKERTIGAFVNAAEDRFTGGWKRSGVIHSVGAISARSLYIAVDQIPRSRGHFWGELHVYGIASVVPFHSTFVPEVEYKSSAHYLTEVYNEPGERAGRGTSTAADLYVNYGYVGLIVILFLAGVVTNRVQQRARRTGSLPWIVAYIFAIQSALMARYTFLHFVRAVFWSVAAVWLLALVLRLPFRPAGVAEDGRDAGEGDTNARAS